VDRIRSATIDTCAITDARMSERMNRRGSILLHQSPRVIRKDAVRSKCPDRDFREPRGNSKWATLA
jgi:hypothetical protein